MSVSIVYSTVQYSTVVNSTHTKYADDTYLIVPAEKSTSCQAELGNIKQSKANKAKQSKDV